LEVGAEGGFKLDLRQDCDPEKQELKGAVRTETYRHHYCQQGCWCLSMVGGRAQVPETKSLMTHAIYVAELFLLILAAYPSVSQRGKGISGIWRWIAS
jgi:hypothetical protein